jgi:hypothetical protein
VIPNGAQVVVRGLVGNWADIGFGFVYRPFLYCQPPPPASGLCAPAAAGIPHQMIITTKPYGDLIYVAESRGKSQTHVIRSRS